MNYTLDSAIPVLKNDYDGVLKDKINIFTQFFIHENKERRNEILFCLHKNVLNPHIDKIYLLNERIYTTDELGGCVSEKILQINIGKRLAYSDIFHYIEQNNVLGFFCFINADIFFDETLKQLHLTNLAEEKIMFAQLRFEYDNITQQSVIFGPTSVSQDTWIFHTNFIKEIKKNIEHFNILLGMPGCDNKILYLLNIIGFKIINHPDLIKTYHYHTTQIRDYIEDNRISMPYVFVNPINYLKDDTDNINDILLENKNTLYKSIKTNIKYNKKFIILSFLMFHEIMFAFTSFLLKSSLSKEEENKHLLFLNNMDYKPQINKLPDYYNYFDLTINTFMNCDIFAGDFIRSSIYYHFIKNTKYKNNIIDAYNYIDENFGGDNKYININALENINYFYNFKFTYALENKRILIISPFYLKIKENISYGMSNFPNCKIIIMNQPNDDYKDYDNYTNQLDEIKEDYDIALVSCNNYYCLMTCTYIFEKHNKSAISIDNIQHYFDIL